MSADYIKKDLLPFLDERIDAAEFDIQDSELDQRPEDRREAELRFKVAAELRSKIQSDYYKWRQK